MLRLDSGLDGSRSGVPPRAVPVPPCAPVTPPVPVPLVEAPPVAAPVPAPPLSSLGAPESAGGVLEQPAAIRATNDAIISLCMGPPEEERRARPPAHSAARAHAAAAE